MSEQLNEAARRGRVPRSTHAGSALGWERAGSCKKETWSPLGVAVAHGRRSATNLERKCVRVCASTSQSSLKHIYSTRGGGSKRNGARRQGLEMSSLCSVETLTLESNRLLEHSR